MEKPDKIIYKNQKEVHEQIVKFIKSKLPDDVKEVYLVGSSTTGEFGRYVEKYGDHDGSDIDVIVFIDNDRIPESWRYLKVNKRWWKLYTGGRTKINGTSHRLDFMVVKEGKEELAKRRIKELDWNEEKIV